MTRGKLTAKQTNVQKWKRMKLILDKLKDGPLSSSEIDDLVYPKSADNTGKRTIQNYMAELRELGLVENDTSQGFYFLTENKRVFQSKVDLELALKHSKRLLFTAHLLFPADNEKQRFDYKDPYYPIDSIAFCENPQVPTEHLSASHELPLALSGTNREEGKVEKNLNFNKEHFCLRQHINTGYPEIFFWVKKYKEKSVELSEKHPFYSFPHYPVWGSLDDFDEFSQRGLPTYVERQEKKRKLREENPEVREFFNLRDLLVGKLYSLVDEVQNGIPLEGSCDLCPYGRFTIREK